VIDGVGDAGRILQVEPLAAENGVVDIDDIAQHREQMFLDATDHLAVDESAGRRVFHFQLDAPGLAAEADLEILEAVEDRAHIVGFQARTEHGERAAAEQLIDAALAGAQQLLNFALGEIFEAA
jgi:hypothetical protein